MMIPIHRLFAESAGRLSGRGGTGRDTAWAAGRAPRGDDGRQAVGTWRAQGGQYQALLLHWDGATWTAQSGPTVGPGSHLLLSVAARAADDVWAVGYYDDLSASQTLIMHWDGTQWSISPSPPYQSFATALLGVVALAPNDAWTVGGAGSIPVILHWDGTQWNSTGIPGAARLTSIVALAPNDIWVAGFETIHWDGSQWTVGFPLTPAYFLEGLAAAGPTDIWTVGSYDMV